MTIPAIISLECPEAVMIKISKNADIITKNTGRSLLWNVEYGSGHMPATAIAPERNDAAVC